MIFLADLFESRVILWHLVRPKERRDVIIVSAKIEAFFIVPGVFRVNVFTERWHIATQGRTRIFDIQLLLLFIRQIKEPLGGTVHPLHQFGWYTMVFDIEETNFCTNLPDLVGDCLWIRTIEQ